VLHGAVTLSSLGSSLLLSVLVAESSVKTALDVASDLVLGTFDNTFSLGGIVLGIALVALLRARLGQVGVTKSAANFFLDTSSNGIDIS
jgi:hypothetical protein